jgi:hypothetical protein
MPSAWIGGDLDAFLNAMIANFDEDEAILTGVIQELIS